MIRCGNCGKEVEEGHSFCPYCAEPLTADASARLNEAQAASGAVQKSVQGRERFLQNEDLEPPSAIPLSSFGERGEETRKSQRKLFIVIGAASLVLLGALAWLFSTDAGRSFVNRFNPPAQAERLEGALRPGTPEFDEAMQRVRLDFVADDHATTSPRAIGDTIAMMRPTIRNFSNRTINGVELRAAGYDLDGNVLKERTYVVIPKRQPEIEPNKTYTPELVLEGFKQTDFIAKLTVEITGITFKP